MEHQARISEAKRIGPMTTGGKPDAHDQAKSHHLNMRTLGMGFVLIALLWLALLLPSFLPWYSAVPLLLLFAGEVLIASSRIAGS